MSRQGEYRDTCEWCGSGTNMLQASGSTGLCVSCCPDMSEDDVPDGVEELPRSWHHMSEEERDFWLETRSIEAVIQEFDWGSPPERGAPSKNTV